MVIVTTERARGCGYRKPAKDGVGIYLVGGKLAAPCGLLPYPLEICPCCGGGIKAARGWSWVTPQLLFRGDVLSKLAGVERECDRARAVRSGRRLRVAGSGVSAGCVRSCPIGNPPAGQHGLLWIGEKFYASSDDFTRESDRQGVSRKIKAIPNGFQLGETWVLLAHRKAVRNPATGEREFPGIFSMFLPDRVDLVVADEHAVPEKAVRMAEKLGDGARILKVVRDVDTQLELTPAAAEVVP